MLEVTGLPAPLGAAPPVPAAAPRRKVLVFRAAGEWFAVALARVREVCPRAPVTRVPRAPAQVLGVMNLRGRVVTLVDLARCLDLPADGGAGAHVVLLDLGDPDLAVGLVADRIDQVVDLYPDAAAGALPPAAADGGGTPGAWGKHDPQVVEIGGRAVPLLDPVQVLAQALPGVEREQTGDSP